MAVAGDDCIVGKNRYIWVVTDLERIQADRISELEREVAELRSLLDRNLIPYDHPNVVSDDSSAEQPTAFPGSYGRNEWQGFAGNDMTEGCGTVDRNDIPEECRAAGSDGIPYENQSKTVLEDPPIAFPRITPEHAKILYSWFKGRKDVYSRRTKNKGYFPVCNNFWNPGICPKVGGGKVRCQDCPNKDYKPLSIRALMAHLSGEKEDATDVVGIYPLLPDDTCHFLVFDFDNHAPNAEDGSNDGNDWQEDVNVLRSICSANGIDALVERSRSGRGAHVWIFFTEAIPASLARQFGTALLTKGAESVNMKNFRSYDRMIPLQDHLPEGGLGNLIALPLQGQALRNGNSTFVDENWFPFSDPWAKLQNTRRLDRTTVEKIIGEQRPALRFPEDGSEKVSEKPWERPPTSLSQEDAVGEMKILLANGIYIFKQNLKPRLQNRLRRMAAYNNPAFFKNLALGYSTFSTPRIIYCGYDTDEYICLPRGCDDQLFASLNKALIRYDIKDLRCEGRPINVDFSGTLFPEQRKATDMLLSHETGVLGAATAFGKTVVGASLIASLKVNALVLVRNSEILRNWQEDLQRFLKINEPLPAFRTRTGRLKTRKSLIGSLQAGQDNLTGIVDIAMAPSLCHGSEVNPVVKEYGLVILDECHHAGANTEQQILRAVAAKHVYGLSATPKREDRQDRKIFLQLGPVRYRYTALERALKQGIAHIVIPRFTRMVSFADKEPGIAEINRQLIADEARNALIIQDVKQGIQEGRTPVVLTKYRAHAVALYSTLEHCADHVFLLLGGKSRKERDSVRQKMLDVPPDQSLIVVAIGKYIGEGFNYPRLDTLHLAMPISWEGNVEQYAGRLNRGYETKKDVLVFDYVDIHVRTLERMYLKRMRAYRQIGFQISTGIRSGDEEAGRSIFDAASCRNALREDLLRAKREIVLSSPGLSIGKARTLVELMTDRLTAGVRLTILTLPPESYSEKARDVIGMLRESGIQVRTSAGCRKHFAVIDGTLVWYGSMNLLSRDREEDSMMRLTSPSIAAELLELGQAKGSTLFG